MKININIVILYCFFIITIINCGNQNNTQSSSNNLLSIHINQPIKSTDTIINYSIINHTSNNYFLGGDFQDGDNGKYSFYNIEIMIFDSNDSIIKPINGTSCEIYNEKAYLKQAKDDSLLMYKYKKIGVNKSIHWLKRHQNLISKSLIINKNKTLLVKTYFGIIQENIKSGMNWYELDKDKNYKIQMAFYFEPKIFKEFLLPKEIDSLRKNNIKIFHGTVYSNKVPLIVE